MDDKFQKYLNNKIKWTKFSCDVLFWIAVIIVAELLNGFYFSENICSEKLIDTTTISPSNLELMGEISDVPCLIEQTSKSWAFALFLLLALRIPFLIKQKGGALSLRGLYPHKQQSNDWNIKDTIIFTLIEWLPAFLGALYVTTVKTPENLYEANLLCVLIIGTQLIWLAPIIFRYKGKNLAELISGINAQTTLKKQQKIQKSYEKTYKRRTNIFVQNLASLIYISCISIFLISFIQFWRMPDLNLDYQKILYGSARPVWEDNVYFALAGLNAPENVDNFYQYGMIKSSENAKLYETFKIRGGVDTQYINDIPALENNSIIIDEASELSVNREGFKSLDCLYKLGEEKGDNCANIKDIRQYIAQNKTLWDRFNKAPDLGTTYYMPPQLMGSNIINLLDLSELKAVQIIYLAEQGESDKAMREWLKFMSLYRAMANNRDSIVYKAMISIYISFHMDALEKLLFLEPDLAKTYREDLLNALNYDKPIFRDPYLLADDWSFIEPFANGALGKAHAAQNDYLKCIIGYKQLAETALDEFPFDKGDVNLCPLQEDQDLLSQTLIYPLMTEGSYTVNTIFSLLARNSLQGQGLLKTMKIKQVNFRVASLAVEILAQHLSAEEASIFVKQAPVPLQNPIIKAPFIWDEDEMHLSYKLPNRDDFIFRLNLNKQK